MRAIPHRPDPNLLRFPLRRVLPSGNARTQLESTMLDTELKSQLAAYLEKLQQPIELVASLDDSDASRELDALLADIAALSPKISRAGGDDARKPSFLIRRVGTDVAVGFAGIPLGHEFTSLVLALLQVGGHPSKEAQDTIERVKTLDGDYTFETYFSLSCQNCPDVVQALNLMSVLNPRIRHTAIDGALFQDEVETRGVMAVPSIFLNGQPFGQGRMSLEQILAKLDTGAAERAAEEIAAKAPSMNQTCSYWPMAAVPRLLLASRIAMRSIVPWRRSW